MRFKGHHGRRKAACLRGDDDASQQRLVTTVNAIEIADRQCTRRSTGPVRRAASYLHKNADDAVRKATSEYTVERCIVMIYRAFKTRRYNSRE